jgi:integrase
VSVSKLEAALVLWLSFELYLRPSEPYHIRATDLVRPARGRQGHDSWSETLHAAETEVLSKTAEYDEALKLDLPRQELLGPALEASVAARLGPDWRRPRPAAARGAAAGGRASGAAPEPLLFVITQREVSSALSAAARALGIDNFLPGLHPYMLRHGGASHDYGSKARSLVDVQRRGRWQSWHSVRRYEKGARLSQVLQMVPAAMQDHAARCADSLGEIVSGRRCPFTPP